MSNPGLTKTRTAGGAIAGRRIVKHGASDGAVLQASAATDALIGVSERLTVASGERVDIVLSGLVEVDYGGNVTRGGPLTADANGKAIAAAPAAGATMRIIGFADVSGVSGDIGQVLIAPGFIQGEEA